MEDPLRAEFIGWDCANRTLAHSHFTLDMQLGAKLRPLIAEALTSAQAGNIPAVTAAIDAALVLTRGFYHSITTDVKDILGRVITDTTAMQRTKLLRAYLNGADAPALEPLCRISIEQQPGKIGMGGNTTGAATAVENQLAFHFADAKSCMLISPKLKNAISFRPDLTYDVILAPLVAKIVHPVGSQKYKDALSRAKYTAAKRHSTLNHQHFHRVFGASAAIAHIPKAVADDCADSWYTAWVDATINCGFKL